jgi:hypothetical protein
MFQLPHSNNALIKKILWYVLHGTHQQFSIKFQVILYIYKFSQKRFSQKLHKNFRCQINQLTS